MKEYQTTHKKIGILGCTEIPLLVNEEEDTGVPLFDTTVIHAEAALNYALE